MKAGPHCGHPEFLALLRALPGDWNQAKADAFEQLVFTFPDPVGPPEWGLRQIQRGQFDRRLPPAWKHAFVEVYHQWLGFRAEAEAEAERSPAFATWWTRPLVASLDRHGWGGLLLSPAAILVLIVLFGWSCLAAGAVVRRDVQRDIDRALMKRQAVVDEAERSEHALLHVLTYGTDDALLDFLARQETQRAMRDRVLQEHRLLQARMTEGRSGTWFAWPWRILD